MLAARGEEHEQRYVESLRAQGLNVVAVPRGEGRATAESLARHTGRDASRNASRSRGHRQARLAHADLAGYADILLRVERPSALGAWSYEVQDTKLARETKGGTILQLCAYSELLEQMQGCAPERFHVVTPDPVQPLHTYRIADYRAYYRMVRSVARCRACQGHERAPEARTIPSRWSTATCARGRGGATRGAARTTICPSSPAQAASTGRN